MRQNNKDTINTRNHNYYETHKNKISENKKKYYQQNKERIVRNNVLERKNRLLQDELFAFSCRVRDLISKGFRRGYSKNKKTYDILGCTYDEARQHLLKT